jgi:hypothetical protein
VNKRSLLSAFLTAILIGGSILVSLMRFSAVQAATEVTGIISSDTTWTKANSPINITGPTAIAKGVTLTIEPGVVVDFNTYTLEVNGAFRAIGTSAEPITLDGDWNGGPFISEVNGILKFTNESDSWDDQTGTGCIIENVNAISLSVFIYDTTVKLNNNVFSGSHEFHGLRVHGGSSVISNNLITDGAVGVDDGSPVFVTNTFMGETLWLQGGSPTIENNLFYGEHSGIDVSDGSNVRVVNNIIAKCSGFSTSLRGNVTFEHNLVLYCSEGLTLYGHNENIIVQNNTIVAASDVDGDGQAEIVTGGYFDSGSVDVAQLCVWDGASLAFENVQTWWWTGNTVIESVGVGDVDGDGGVVVVSGGWFWDGSHFNSQLCIWSGDSLGVEAIRTWCWGSGSWITSVAVGNVDGDAYTEIVTGGYFHDGIRNCAQTTIWEIS